MDFRRDAIVEKISLPGCQTRRLQRERAAMKAGDEMKLVATFGESAPEKMRTILIEGALRSANSDAIVFLIEAMDLNDEETYRLFKHWCVLPEEIEESSEEEDSDNFWEEVEEYEMALEKEYDSSFENQSAKAALHRRHRRVKDNKTWNNYPGREQQRATNKVVRRTIAVDSHGSYRKMGPW